MELESVEGRRAGECNHFQVDRVLKLKMECARNTHRFIKGSTRHHMFGVEVVGVRLKFYKKNVPRLFGRWMQ